MTEISSERLIMRTEISREKVRDFWENEKNNYPKCNLLNLKEHKIEDQGFGFYLKNQPNIQVCHIGLRMDRKPYEISYGTEKDYRNDGYIREAIDCMINWLFSNSDINKIYALISNNNTSKKILEEKGFILEEENKNQKWYCLIKK